jgi:hypothetical protein
MLLPGSEFSSFTNPRIIAVIQSGFAIWSFIELSLGSKILAYMNAFMFEKCFGLQTILLADAVRLSNNIF